MQFATEGASIAETHANLHPSPRKTSAVRGPRLGCGGIPSEGGEGRQGSGDPLIACDLGRQNLPTENTDGDRYPRVELCKYFKILIDREGA